MGQTMNKHYMKVHYWLRNTFGKASKCENPDCSKVYTNYYEWAKKRGVEYDFKRENFIQLCKSCHAKYDLPEGTNRTKKLIRTVDRGSSLKTHCKRGHELTGENLRYKNRENRKWRECVTCQKLHRQNYRRRLKGLPEVQTFIYQKKLKKPRFIAPVSPPKPFITK